MQFFMLANETLVDSKRTQLLSHAGGVFFSNKGGAELLRGSHLGGF